MKIIQWVVDQHARSLAGNYYRRCGLFAFIAQCPDGEYQAAPLLGEKYSIPSYGTLAAGGKIECLMPGGLCAPPLAGDDHFDEVRLAIARGGHAALQRGPQIVARRDPLAGDTLAFREFDKVDVRVAEIHPCIFPGFHHASAVLVVGVAHRLVVAVVPDDREDGNAIAGLGPETGGAVHHRAIADGTDHLTIWSSELGADGCPDAPAK